MAVQQVSERVFVETGHLGSNNSIVVGDDGVMLVDAPHRPTDAIRWADVASSYGRVRFVVNTDHHPDHTIGNFWLPGEVVSHVGTRQRLVEEPPTDVYLRDLMARIDPDAVPLMDDYRVRVPEIVFDDRLTLHGRGVTLELRFQPGHTRNSLLAYLPEDEVLFTGDIVCEAGLPSFQDARIQDWFDALDVVESYDFEALIPGHGEVTDRAGVERYRALGRELVGLVAEAISRGHEVEQAADEIRFEDNIHVDTDTYVGYPDSLIEVFQRRSIETIYRDLLLDQGLVDR